MRLFLAAPISAAALEAISARVGEIAWAEQVRVVEPRRWHLTMAFFGEVEPEVLEGCLEPRLRQRLARLPGFRLQVTGAGLLRRSVGFIAVNGVTEQDTRAAREVALRAARTGVRCGAGGGREHPFRPHITIARQRSGAAELRAGITALADARSGPWRVEFVELIRSHLGAQPCYEPLARLPLAPIVADAPGRIRRGR